MKIAILGNGIEGKSVAEYFKNEDLTVFDEGEGVNFGDLDLAGYDLVFRSPSVDPRRLKEGEMTSVTRYFFEKCPAKIIGVTATKGKGTTCSLIKSILEAAGRKVWLLGNIGVAALSVLDEISADDVVVYELSSFQLWDMTQSPWRAVVGMMEADHLNVHGSMEDYVTAKRNIVRWQGAGDMTVYYAGTQISREIGEGSEAEVKLAYPSEKGAHIADEWFYFGDEQICETSVMKIPGKHNAENALAAISVCFDLVLKKDIEVGLASFEGLPHRTKFVRELDGVRYYDNSIATVPGSTIADIAAFDEPKVLIVGGSTKGAEFDELAKAIAEGDMRKVLLIGPEGKRAKEALDLIGFSNYEDLGEDYNMESLVARAREIAQPGDVVLLSPAAASFDRFKSYSDRGEQFVAVLEAL